MKISIRTAGSGAYAVLADESDRTATVADFAPQLGAVVQVEPMFRAASVGVWGRGNRQWTLGFVIERTHASRDAAMAFVVSHPAAVPGSADLQIEQGGTVTLMAGAALVGLKPEVRGQSSVWTYQWVGPSYVDATPAP